MTRLSPESGAEAPPPAPGRPSAAPHCALSRLMLERQIARRRAHLAEFETAMIAACEAAAFGGRSPPCPRVDRAGWDRTTWHRYLAAAKRLEATYGPPMRRLREDIARLERLLTLPIIA